MRKEAKSQFSLFVILAVALLLVSVFAVAQGNENVEANANEGAPGLDNGKGNPGGEIDEVELDKKVEKVKGISNETKDFVKEFVKKRRIDAEKINNISQIDFNSLPKEISIENIDDSNLGIFQVNYNDSSNGDEGKDIFVVTYSVEQLRKQGDLIIAHDKRQFLDFGYAGEGTESIFLETATGISTSLENGYVMMRPGSVTGLSTNIEITKVGDGEIEVVIFKNGEAVGFGNVIVTDSVEVKVDYDVQSSGVIKFVPGDVISVYLNADNSDASWSDVITLLEITTTN